MRERVLVLLTVWPPALVLERGEKVLSAGAQTLAERSDDLLGARGEVRGGGKKKEKGYCRRNKAKRETYLGCLRRREPRRGSAVPHGVDRGRRWPGTREGAGCGLPRRRWSRKEGRGER